MGLVIQNVRPNYFSKELLKYIFMKSGVSLYRTSSSPSSTSTSSGSDGPTPCKDGCCRTINVLSKQEELL